MKRIEVLVLLLTVGILHAEPIPFPLTLQDVSTLTALEATQNDLLLTAAAFGQTLTVQPLGRWEGTVTGEGWILTFAGAMNGIPLSITQTGKVNPGTGVLTWTDLGAYGSTPGSGLGFFDLDPTLGQVFFGAAVTGVQRLSKSTVVAVLGGAMVSAVLIKGEDFLETSVTLPNPISPFTQMSSEAVPGNFPIGLPIFIPPGVLLDQSGIQDPISGRTSFDSSIVPVPEPSSLLLFSSGLLTLIPISRRYLRRR